LVAHYQPRLIAWCRSRGLDEAATHDVLQEVWVSVARSLPSFSSTTGQGAFRAWLWRIMQRRIIDFRRQQGREPNAAGGSTMLGRLASIPANSESDAESSSNAYHQNSPDSGQRQLDSYKLQLTTELQQILDRAQMDYEPRTWQAFLRCAMDGHSTEQVAAEFNMTVVGVRQLRSRILRRLRRELEMGQN
jgi:RNA polymerase sigma-70 factor (ECF subfamily)